MAPARSQFTSTLHSRSQAATEALGQALGGLVRPGDVVLLSGDLGAGKTQLTKGIARGLGVAEQITSPTFNLVLVHEGRTPLYHVDLYRLDSAEQLEDIGYFDALEGGGLAVVEWGDRFDEARPEDRVDARLEIDGDESRVVSVAGTGARGAALASAWTGAARAIPGITVEASP